MPDASQQRIIASLADLERAFGTTGIDGVENAIYAWLEFDGEVLEDQGTFTLDGDVLEAPNGIELRLGRSGTYLTFPFSLDDVEQVVEELEKIFESEIEE